MEYLQGLSATAPQSAESSNRRQADDQLMAAWHRARERAGVTDASASDLQKADFSPLIDLLASKMDRPKLEGFNPWELEQKKADCFNAEEQPPDSTGYDCRICKNKEMVYGVKALPDGTPHHFMQPCRCVETRRTIRRMQRSGLENIISDNLFPKYEAVEPWQVTIKAAAMEYAKSLQGWFFIGGQSGCGKTHLCTAICREELLRGKQVVYMMWRDEAPKLKAAVNNEDYAAMVNPYKTAEFLYIDDLFKTGANNEARKLPTGGDVNLAFEIINYRYVSKLPTLISSEFVQRELIDIDEALTGRIVQMAGTNNFNINLDRKKNYRLRGMVEL